METNVNTTISKSLTPTLEQYTADAAIKVDWFNFETRMRSLMKDMLDPCLDTTQDIAKQMKNMESRVSYMQGQIQELEFQVTRLDVIFKKLDEQEGMLSTERNSKDLDIQRLQTEISIIKPELMNHAEQLKQADDHREKLKKEINTTNNKLIASKEDMLGQIGGTNSKVLHEMNNVLMRIKEEEDKRHDFEGLMENIKSAVESHHTELAEIKLYHKEMDKTLEDFKSNK